MYYAVERVGLSVSELDAASSFYEKAFGFAPEVAFELPGAIRGLMMIGAMAFLADPEGNLIELAKRR
jgi:catechol-2,3-dioxygenase